MERRRHARTPVNLNAMLIGQTTVPKGCRVRNISQQGMLLQCEPDGRLLTFNKGDKVEIHLSVQYAGEKKSFTIPSSVRHVNEAYIYVEFQHPDLKLVELIESYRISEAHELEASVGYGDAKASGSNVTRLSDTAAPMETDESQPSDKKTSYRPFYYGLLTLVLIICIVTGGYIYTASIDNRLDMLETITDHQTSELAEMRERVFSSTLQEGRYASLNARMTALTNAFTTLDDKLGLLVSQRSPDTLPKETAQAGSGSGVLITPPPAVTAGKVATARPVQETVAAATQQQETSAPAEQAPSERQAASQPAPEAAAHDTSPQQITTATPDSSPATPAETDIVASETAAPPASGSQAVAASQAIPEVPVNRPVDAIKGPWIINLLSSRDKGYVEKYAARARARDVSVEINSAEVKGREYWRLQITGFETAGAAKAHAGPVREKLGIKDVWIFRR